MSQVFYGFGTKLPAQESRCCQLQPAFVLFFYLHILFIHSWKQLVSVFHGESLSEIFFAKRIHFI